MVGPWGASFISLAIIVSTFGITNVFILTGARVYQSWPGTGLSSLGRAAPSAVRDAPCRDRPPVRLGVLPSADQHLRTASPIRDVRRLDFFRADRPGPDRPPREDARSAAALSVLGLSRRPRCLLSSFRPPSWSTSLSSSFLKSLIGSAIILAGLPLYYYCGKRRRPWNFRPVEYMEWAKLKSAAAVNLSRSGMPGSVAPGLGR